MAGGDGGAGITIRQEDGIDDLEIVRCTEAGNDVHRCYDAFIQGRGSHLPLTRNSAVGSVASDVEQIGHRCLHLAIVHRAREQVHEMETVNAGALVSLLPA